MSISRFLSAIFKHILIYADKKSDLISVIYLKLIERTEEATKKIWTSHMVICLFTYVTRFGRRTSVDTTRYGCRILTGSGGKNSDTTFFPDLVHLQRKIRREEGEEEDEEQKRKEELYLALKTIVAVGWSLWEADGQSFCVKKNNSVGSKFALLKVKVIPLGFRVCFIFWGANWVCML